MSGSKREVKRIDRSDGKRSVTIEAREDGFFEYAEWTENFEDLRYVGLGIDRTWVPLQFSGIYETAELAEQDARLAISWLAENLN